MSETPVVFDHVWKKFQRNQHHGWRRRSTMGPPSDAQLSGDEFWALRDVSFQVKRGEALGIIGPNGAGKSTTLKLLTRIMRPTHGQCGITGRVGALIEVAAGFHPDLTGRENIFLQGAVMGMKRAEIQRRLDEIVDFSGLSEFIDTQVKRYSSGMNARLGFSIAAHLEPDVLVIDEVLAVGDMVFQQRCIEKMHAFTRQDVAIVFVSHDLQAVASLCQRSLFLSGSVKAAGNSESVIAAYVASVREGRATQTDSVRVTRVELVDASGRDLPAAIAPGTPLSLKTTFLPSTSATYALFQIRVYRSTDDLMVYETKFMNSDLGLPELVAGIPFDIEVPFFANLTRGHYNLTISIQDRSGKYLAQESAPLAFAINELQSWSGMVHLDVQPKAASVDRAVN